MKKKQVFVNLKEISVLSVIILLMAVNSCKNDGRVDTSNQNDVLSVAEKKVEIEARLFLITPDSLRSEEEKELFKKLEAVIFDLRIVNDRFEMVLGEKDWKEKGLPVIYFDLLKKDISDLNKSLDTLPSSTACGLIQAFKEAQDEYLATKKTESKE